MNTKNKTSAKSQPQRSVTLPLGFEPIQDHCMAYRAGLNLLDDSMLKLNAAIAEARNQHMPSLRSRVNALGSVRISLVDLIDSRRPLFDKPKTRIFSDIKVGLRKQPGRIGISDKDKTIELIKKHCPERLDELAPATRQLSKEALEKLPADLLKKLSVEVTADQEKVIIEPQDSDVEKAVAALLQESQTDLKAAA
jgi:hypothetical protein